jgi:beta-glucanase (GH16 family)
MKMIAAIIILVLTACSKKSGNPPDGANLSLSINDVSQSRSKDNSQFRFNVNLTAAATKQVTVDYTTVAGTAVAGKDFLSKSGTLIINAGSQQGFIDITVVGDSLRQSDQLFYVQLSHPVNATVGTGQGTGTIGNTEGSWLPTDNSGYTSPSSYAGYNLAWSDEFNGPLLDNTTWNYEQGGNGWGNNELENYTDRKQNLLLSNGNLIIEARKESYQGNNYTSARITTQNKKTFTFGRIDIRAKLPVSKGMWPALWMLGSNLPTVNWPACGELDMMELVGSAPKQVTGTMHWASNSGQDTYLNNNYVLASQDFSQQFHVFSIVWAQDSVKWLVDDNQYFSGIKANVTNGPWPFNNPFFFIFNVAVGGNWPGAPDNTTSFPQRMFVDYIRVFQK